MMIADARGGGVNGSDASIACLLVMRRLFAVRILHPVVFVLLSSCALLTR